MSSKIIVALDYSTAEEALNFVAKISPDLCALKIGKELFTAAGPQLVEQLVAKGYKIFLDLKYHDIPNTVAKACLAAANLGVWMLNVHALGGERMMRAAREAIDTYSGPKPLLIAVTVLTSHDDIELAAVGLNGAAEENVLRLAKLTQQAGLDGVVCSAMEAPLLKEECGPEFCLVTPGIRLTQTDDDQRRVMTPAAALAAGSSYLVIGRPITQSTDPAATLERLFPL